MSKNTFGGLIDKAIFHIFKRGEDGYERVEMSWTDFYEDVHPFFDDNVYRVRNGICRMEGWLFDAFGKCEWMLVDFNLDGTVKAQERETD